MGQLILDTTVLLYATGRGHELREPCRRLLAAVRDGDLRATTTVEALQEFMYVRARTVPRSVAGALASAYAVGLQPLTVTTEEHLRAGIRVWQRHERLGSFDAVLAAVAMSSDSTLVSADRAFSRIRNLDHVVPDARGVRRLIAG